LTADADAGGGECHHHLICRSCGRTADVPGSALELWLASAGGDQEFADVTSTGEVFGTCTDCAAAALFRPAAGRDRRQARS
jgi:Fur family ferric uptake transcriptional regulator